MRGKKLKIYRLLYELPGREFYDYILMPVGYKYNEDLAKAKMGEILQFAAGERRCIRRICHITDPKVADALCLARYNRPLKQALNIWRRDAVLFGNVASAVSDSDFLLVIYDEVEEYDTVERTIQNFFERSRANAAADRSNRLKIPSDLPTFKRGRGGVKKRKVRNQRSKDSKDTSTMCDVQREGK